MKVTICLLAIIGYCFGAAVSPLATGEQPANSMATLEDEYGAGIEPISVGIVGGNTTTIEQFPWIVSMHYNNTNYYAASIISSTRFISAAHCTLIAPASDLQLRAGSSFSQSGGQFVQVSKVVMHPQFNLRTVENDICILWIETPLNMAPAGVSPIGLPAQGASVSIGALALAAGWGRLCTGCETSPVLRYVAMPIISNTECKKNYSSINNVTDGMVCAGFPKGGHSICKGDSGGSLTINGTLIGIVSWTKGCADPGFPGVNTRVAFYRNWIDSNV